MLAYNWDQAKDVINTYYYFNFFAGIILKLALLAFLFNSKYVRDYFNDLYIGMAIFAICIKFARQLKFYRCFFTLLLNEDLKLCSNSYVV